MIGINEMSVGSLEAIRDVVTNEIVKKRASGDGGGIVYWKLIQTARGSDMFDGSVQYQSVATTVENAIRDDFRRDDSLATISGALAESTILVAWIWDRPVAVLRVKRGASTEREVSRPVINGTGIGVLATIEDQLDKQSVLDEYPELARYVGSQDLPLRLALSRLGLYKPVGDALDPK